MVNPCCLIISGPSGSGKSTTARILWRSLGGNPAYLNLDSIKHLVNGAESSDYFLDLARANALCLTENFLRAGHSVIVDKAFGDYTYVKDFTELARRRGIPSYYFKLTAPLPILIERADRRRDSPLQKKIETGEWPLPVGNEETVRKIHRFFMEHQHEEGIEIDTSYRTPREVAAIISSYIA